MVKTQDPLGSDKHHMQEASYLWEEQEKCDQGVNQETSVIFVIFFFPFELSGGYMSVCLVTFCMFTIFHNNNKHHRNPCGGALISVIGAGGSW